MKINILLKAFLITAIIVFAASCDKDYNEIGSDIVGGDNDHYSFKRDSTMSVLAYNQATGFVQSNNLPINTLGYYNNPVFGKTTASFVTQLELGTADPQFINTSNPLFKIDSVYLYVPYFSTLDETDADTGDKTYTLDSIYNQDKKIKLSVYESGYYLRDFDASTGFQEAQKYYSNQNDDFNQVKIGSVLNDTDDTSQNTNFKFKKDEIKLTYVNTTSNEVVVKERKTPGIWLDLNKQFFMTKIVNAPTGKLLNNNVFKEYFRGLYFKVEPNTDSPDDGALNKIDFSKGVITMVYHDETSTSDTTIKRKTLNINLKGNSVNVFENQYNSNFTNIINNPNTTTGDQRLYLKGGVGSMAVIELFGADADASGTADEIEQIKAEGWLINEANLTFYIDKNAMTTAEEPNRIYLYDLQNRRPLLDYYRDQTSYTKPKFSKFIHDGIIEKEEVDNGRGIKYKIRITEHVRNLIKNDSTNVKLGLVVTESISNVTNNKLKTPISSRLDRIPVASIINPLGTILYGQNVLPADENKKLKLNIYYTKPD